MPFLIVLIAEKLGIPERRTEGSEMKASTRICRELGLVLLIGATMGTTSAQAGYIYTKIAEVSGNSVLDIPAINNAGTVVFKMQNNSTGLQNIFTGTGGPLTTVVTNQGGTYLGFSDAPVINASGSVAFLAGQRTAGGSSGLGIFRADGNSITTIANTVPLGGPFLTFDGPLSMNASGKVAFTGQLFSTGEIGVYTGSCGAITTIANFSGGTFQSFFPTRHPSTMQAWSPSTPISVLSITASSPGMGVP
jgi:hypothetical protein